jgi:uncharacterized protein YjiS (DUF1127 family)
MPNRSSNGLHHHASMGQALEASMANMQDLATSFLSPRQESRSTDKEGVANTDHQHHTLRERAIELYHAWHVARENRHAIRMLLQLDDALLRDIGVHREELFAYMALPFDLASDGHLIDHLVAPHHDVNTDPDHDHGDMGSLLDIASAVSRRKPGPDSKH